MHGGSIKIALRTSGRNIAEIRSQFPDGLGNTRTMLRPGGGIHRNAGNSRRKIDRVAHSRNQLCSGDYGGSRSALDPLPWITQGRPLTPYRSASDHYVS